MFYLKVNLFLFNPSCQTAQSSIGMREEDVFCSCGGKDTSLLKTASSCLSWLTNLGPGKIITPLEPTSLMNGKKLSFFSLFNVSSHFTRQAHSPFYTNSHMVLLFCIYSCLLSLTHIHLEGKFERCWRNQGSNHQRVITAQLTFLPKLQLQSITKTLSFWLWSEHIFPYIHQGICTKS